MEGPLCTQLGSHSKPSTLTQRALPSPDKGAGQQRLPFRRPPAQGQHRPPSPLFPGISAISVSMVTTSRPRRFSSPPSAALSARRSGKPRGLVVLLPASPRGAPPKGFAPSRTGLALEAGTWKAGTASLKLGARAWRCRSELRGGRTAGGKAPGPQPRGRRADQAPAHPAPRGFGDGARACPRRPFLQRSLHPARRRLMSRGHRRGRARRAAPEQQLTSHTGPHKGYELLWPAGPRMRKSTGQDWRASSGPGTTIPRSPREWPDSAPQQVGALVARFGESKQLRSPYLSRE